MPQTRSIRGTLSALRKVRRKAHSLIGNLRREIRVKESELSWLKSEERHLGALVAGTSPSGATRRGGASRRIDWRQALARLPRQFKASDVRGVRGLKDKRGSEIFAAITRWIDAGLVKRKSRGIYLRS